MPSAIATTKSLKRGMIESRTLNPSEMNSMISVPTCTISERWLSMNSERPEDSMSTISLDASKTFGALSRKPSPIAAVKPMLASANLGASAASMVTPSVTTLLSSVKRPSNPLLWKPSSNWAIASLPNVANSRNVGVTESEIAICRDSKALFSRVTSPARLSAMIAAISSAAPLQL